MSVRFAVLVFYAVGLPVSEAEESRGASHETGSRPHFESDIRPILKTHCFQCHGEEHEVGGELDLRLVRFMISGGDSGPAISPGRPADSLLLHRVRNGEMPPGDGKQLGVKEVRLLERWIAGGAATLREEPESLSSSMLITEEEQSHWAFQPVERPEIPDVEHAHLVANPIDSFLLRKLASQKFQLSAPASLEKRIRRLFLVVTGLPPTMETIDRVRQSSNTNPDLAWSALVDELLDSPHYGERWAQHWLDIAGYADSEGYTDSDVVRPDAWRYRDYVIRAFQSDKPFDSFITEQIAGDELITSSLENLSEQDAELLVATGFLRTAPDGTGERVPDAALAGNDTVADTIQIVSSSLMAMTVSCAQCHDHRYDPISQEDYYRFRAIFEPAFDCEKWKSPAQRRVSLYTNEERIQASAIESQAAKLDQERIAKQTGYIAATFEKQLQKLPPELHEVARSAHGKAAKTRTAEERAILKKYPSLNVTSGSLYLYDRKAADTLKKLADEARALRDTKPKEAFVRALKETPGRLPATHLFHRGDHEQPKQKLTPAGLTVISLTSDAGDIPPNAANMDTSGRRLAFARRLTSPSHPLTSRVIVNRLWRHHFGRGLVETPGDFGSLGQQPSHPKLLDWLAAELIDSNWSLKHIHRLILNSTAWQQGPSTDQRLIQSDPDNRLFGRSRLIRIDAEVLRDCMLAAGGQLNLKPFGPAVPVMADRVGRFVIGQENLNAGRPGKEIDMKGEQFRRSIYIQARRSRPLSVLETFDRPAMTPNCDMRHPSTSSTQSLLMMNSDLLLSYSRFLADRVREERPDNTEQQVQRAWQLVYCRNATKSETASATHFLDVQNAELEDNAAFREASKKAGARNANAEALAILCQMLFSSNEFLYVD